MLILFWIFSILFLSIFPICDMRSRIWNRRGDYIDFINFCLFSVYLGTYNWSVVLPSNVTDLKYAQWLKSPRPFKKWAVKVTHPTPLRLCMHGIRVIRTITWLPALLVPFLYTLPVCISSKRWFSSLIWECSRKLSTGLKKLSCRYFSFCFLFKNNWF